MSDTGTIRLPRRKHRPPARLVYHAAHYALCLGWVAYVIGVGTLYPPERVLGACFAVLLVVRIARHHRDLGRTLAAWRDGRAVPSVARGEWALLAGETVFILVWVLVLLPGVVVPS